jgi:TonB family protein
MVAAWMIYAVIIALLGGAVATLVEQALRVWRLPARGVWSSAIIASVLWPLIAVFGTSIGQKPLLLPPVVTGVARPTWDQLWSVANGVVHAQGGRLDVLLLALWGGASLLVLTTIVRSLANVRRIREDASELTIDGHTVLLSNHHGPAVTGLAPSTIVIPRWVLALDPSLRELILLHEREHAEGGDPWLIALGVVAMVVMPWNLGLWWQVRRLRLALEVDCDHRVLRRRPDVRQYGSLLIAVTQRATRSLVPLSTTLVERQSQLERRLTAMTTGRPPRPLLTSLVFAGLAAIVAAVACEAPLPTAQIQKPDAVVAATPARPLDMSANQTYFEFQVEKPVVQAPGSAGPRYPDLLRAAKIEGEVLAQFVVNEDGTVMPGSLKILKTTHDLFSASVKAAMPNMRFVAAEVGDRKVKQLVQQPFTFQLAR